MFVRFGGCGAANNFPTPHHRDAVRDCQYFFELVGNKDDGNTLFGEISVSRRASTAQDFGYGGMKNNTQTVRWQKSRDKVLLRIVSYENVAADRAGVMHAMTSDKVKQAIESRGVELVSYADVLDKQP